MGDHETELKLRRTPPPVHLPLKRSFLSVLAVSVGASSVGYALGYPSSALIDLQRLPDRRAFENGSVESQLFVAFVAVGAVLGSMLGAWLSDGIGRRAAMLANGVLNIIGWLLIFLAWHTETPSAFTALLLLGRLWTGVTCGALGSIVPVYTAEIAPPSKRGLLGAAYQISIICGIFFAYVVGAIPGLNCSHSALIFVLVLTASLPLVLFIKESPRWLLLKNNKSAALKSLLWLFESEEAAKQIFKFVEASLPARKLSFIDKAKMLRQRSIYLPFLLSTLLVVFHQLTGSNVIINYAASIFLMAHIEHAQVTAIYAVGALQIVGTFISAFVVDRVGRKRLLLFGSVGITVSNAALGTHLFFAETSKCVNATSVNTSSTALYNGTFNISFKWEQEELFNSTTDYACHPILLSFIPIASVMGFGLFYSVGWRALPFIMTGEMLPNTLRGSMNGFMSALLWGLAGILIGGFTPYQNAVRPYTAWWVFACIAGLSVPFVAIFVPETKDKTLEEINLYFDGRGKKKIKAAVDSAVNPIIEPCP